MATENTAPNSTNPTEFSPCEEAWECYMGTPAEDRRRPEFDSFLAWALHEFDGDLIWPDVDDPSWADFPDEVETVPWWCAGIDLPAPLSEHDAERFEAAAAACGMEFQLDEDDDLIATLEDRVDRDANGGWDAWRLAEWERAHGRSFAPLGLKEHFTASVDALCLSLVDSCSYEVFKGFVADFIDVVEDMDLGGEVVVPLLEADEKDVFDQVALFFFGNSAHGRDLDQLRRELHDGRQLVLRRRETDAGEAAMALRWGNDEVGIATLAGCFDPRRAAEVAALVELHRYFPADGGPDVDGEQVMTMPPD